MPIFLHAVHQLRQGPAWLDLLSWLMIGLGVGALVLSWGRVLAWLKAPETPAVAVRRWGQDEHGFFVEFSDDGGANGWSVELAGGAVVALEPSAAPQDWRAAIDGRATPIALVSTSGLRLLL